MKNSSASVFLVIGIILLTLATLPSVVVGALFAAVTRLIFGGTIRASAPDGQVTFTTNFPADGWFGRGLYAKWAGTTIGNGIMMKGSPRKSTQAHEAHHVQQFQTYNLGSFMLGVGLGLGYWSLSLAVLVWVLGMWTPFLAGFVRALLLGKNAYRGSTHEVAAYAVGDGKH